MNATILLDHEALEPTARTGRRAIVRTLLRVSGTPPTDDSRVPLNLSLVLDSSGSMAGAKLAAARDAAATLVRRLWPEDVVSVVAYDTQVLTLAEPGREADHPGLSRTLGSLQPGGSTNLSGGWLRGQELVERNRREGAVNRILLLTDGLANEGITEPERLTGLSAHARAHRVTTTTIGFGEGYDEALLRGMADAGGGNAYSIERPDQAGDVFGEELEGLLGLAAQNLAVEVRLGSAAELGFVHHSYPRSPLAEGIRLELGDLYAREPRELLLELAVRVPEESGALGLEEKPPVLPVAEITVQGDVLEADGGVARRILTLPLVLEPGAGPRVEPEVRKRIVLLEAARAREQALEAHRRGEGERGGELLRDAAERLERVAGEEGRAPEAAEELRKEARELGELAARFEAEAVRESDAKYLYQSSYDMGRGRWGRRERMRRGEGDGE